jgi:hypothetical protein
MSDSESVLQALVESWLTDVQRRGAKLYAMIEGDNTLNLSFEGRHELRFGVKIDLAARDVRLQITGPQSNFIERSAFLLNAENLRSLTNRICLVGEGQAIVPVYLLAELSILCHAYERLLDDYVPKNYTDASANTLIRVESELRHYLTPEEQKRTDNPCCKPADGIAKVRRTERNEGL